VINNCGEQMIEFTVKRTNLITLKEEGISASASFAYEVTSVSNSDEDYQNYLNDSVSTFGGHYFSFRGEELIGSTSFTISIHNSNELISQAINFQEITIVVVHTFGVFIMQGDSIQVPIS